MILTNHIEAKTVTRCDPLPWHVVEKLHGDVTMESGIIRSRMAWHEKENAHYSRPHEKENAVCFFL